MDPENFHPTFLRSYENWGGELVTSELVVGELVVGRKSRRISGVANKFAAIHLTQMIRRKLLRDLRNGRFHDQADGRLLGDFRDHSWHKTLFFRLNIPPTCLEQLMRH
jgi:hypothetical protein